MRLYYHKTDGGAEYLTDTFIKCENGHKEGNVNDKTKYIVRIDGDITKDAELNVNEDKGWEEKCFATDKEKQEWIGRNKKDYYITENVGSLTKTSEYNVLYLKK